MVAKRDFTDRFLKSIKAAEKGKRVVIYDAQIPGFGIRVTTTGAKSWIFRYMLRGKAREMGLGSLSTRSLADARTERNTIRAQQLRDRIDPIETRKAQEAQAAREEFILRDDQEKVWNHIKSLRKGRVDFVLDNGALHLNLLASM